MYTEVYGTIPSYAALRALNWIVIDIRHDGRSCDNIYIYIHIEKIAVDIARRGLAHARPDKYDVNYCLDTLVSLCFNMKAQVQKV